MSDLTSLSMIIFRSTHVAAHGYTSFFLTAEYYSTVCMYHVFFIHSSLMDTGYAHGLATVTGAAVNIGVHISF